MIIFNRTSLVFGTPSVCRLMCGVSLVPPLTLPLAVASTALLPPVLLFSFHVSLFLLASLIFSTHSPSLFTLIFISVGTGSGLHGDYYADSTTGYFTTLVASTVDPSINFNWGSVCLPCSLFLIHLNNLFIYLLIIVIVGCTNSVKRVTIRPLLCELDWPSATLVQRSIYFLRRC